MSNQGFFSSSIVSKPIRFKLPQSLNLEFVEEVKKTKVVEIPKSKRTQYCMDIECYVNYFLVKFIDILTDEIIDFELTADHELESGRIAQLISKSEIITFNGNKYDILMLRLALTGATNKQLKQASDSLIQDELPVYKFEEKYDLPKFKIKHIDLIELMFGVASLKMYGARLHSKKLQELPIAPDTVLTEAQMDEINEYCNNDVAITKMAFLEKVQQVELRRTMSKQYKVDLLSKSDAQIAEAVLKAELELILNKEVKAPEVVAKSFHYKVPDFISFNGSILNDALEIVTEKLFSTRSNGVIEMPKELTDLQVKLGSSLYRMGMGGLHSTEKSAFHASNDKYELWDWDVSSYYPAIIIQCSLYPKHLTKAFLTVYKTIVDERLAAKKAGNKVKADSLKIVVNGSFGKLGQPYSTLYAPELMVQVTVTGQLSLLMLIETLESKGMSVVSGNTDGIVIKCPTDKRELMQKIIKRWEFTTGFEMESTQYLGLYSRDVNNYLAVKPNGEVKCKGTFAASSVAKNPENDICTDAMVAYIKHNHAFEHTIKSCTDIIKFLTVRRVNGGAVKDGKYLGKVVRFYHSSKVSGNIDYVTSGDKVPNSDGCRPIMDLPDKFPNDIDYQWYVNKTKEMFK